MIATALLSAGTVGPAAAQEVCRGTDPRCYHDWAKDQREGNRVLIYTRTAGPRHPNLGPPLAAGLNPALTPANVVQSSVIFASTSRDALFAHGRAHDPALAINTSTGAHLDAARTALRQYMRGGGGFVGIHNAFGLHRRRGIPRAA